MANLPAPRNPKFAIDERIGAGFMRERGDFYRRLFEGHASFSSTLLSEKIDYRQYPFLQYLLRCFCLPLELLTLKFLQGL